MRILGVALALATLTSIAAGDTIKPGGNVINETWTAGQGPYIIQGDITIPAGSTLTIQAGTVIQMQSDDLQGGNFDPARIEFVVKGALVINGTAAQPVQFTSQVASPGSWYGIVVDATATGTAITATNVTLTNPVTGIFHRSATATASTSDISMSGVTSAGVRVEAGNPTYNGIATANGSYGFEITLAGSATFTNCIARTTNSTGARFVPNTTGRNLTLTNCTFEDNGTYGILSSTSSGGSITVRDSIVTNSSYGLYRGDAVTWSATYTNVWGNNTNYFGGLSAGVGNIMSNPLYVSSTNLRLTSNSPSRFGAMGGGDMGARPFTTDLTPGLYGVLWTNTTLTAAASPYTVGGDLSVGPGVTLTLSPGTTLTFATTDIMQSGYDPARGELVVRGTLMAPGSTAMPITLQSSIASPGSWYGLVVDPTATGTAVTLTGAVFLNPVTGIFHRSATALASTSNVSMTGVTSAGVRVEAGAPTYDGIATANGSYGFEITLAGSATFTNCVARATNSTGARFVPNTTGRSLTLTNCTFENNGTYGVLSSTSSGGAVTVKNSIVTNSSYGLYRGDAVTWSATYTDVWQNNTNYFGGLSAGVGNISLNPQYVSATNLQLQSTSVAIDAGNATGAPAKDQRGAARPVNGDGINGAEFDMGAYEFAATAICGNGATEGTEVCDSGGMNGMYGYCNSTCTALGPRCGDNMMNGNETCDDGNGVDTDACRNTCVTAACGDGVVRAGVEACDDGNTVPTDNCTATCQIATCGDGAVQAGVEACDDGNQVDTDGCHDCVAATCGDGIVRAGVEGCDDGNEVDDDACNNSCISTTCGDGVVQSPNEQCDDGNDIDTDECRNACIDPICGDNIRQPDEQCDDGNMDNGDGCSSACRYETGPSGDAGIDPGGMDSDGGCCSTGGGGTTGLFAALALVFVLRRRRV